ncbi:MAG: hypothetical protein HGN29_13040 [Asgard group archaeon]|nr:hypothetical protein [Asgard group archaeon]
MESKKFYVLFLIFSLFLALIPNSSCSSNPVLSVTKGSFVEGHIFYANPLIEINSSYSDFSYEIEDIWRFKDIREEVIQFKETYLNIYTNKNVFLCPTFYHWSRLIWKQNGTYALHTAQLIAEHSGFPCDRYNISISLLDYNKFEDMSDKLNAVITFKNGSQTYLRDYLPNAVWYLRGGGYETNLFLNKSWTFYSPPIVPYIISPEVDIGHEIDTGFCKGIVTDFTSINDTPTQYDVIEVKYPSIKIENLGETHVFSSRTRYYERKTGLMIKEYFVNESTNESYLFEPEKIKIAEKIVKPEFNYHVPLIVLIIILVAKKTKRKRKVHV